MVRIGAFELTEPVPELNEPHVLGVIPELSDAGAAASLTLSQLEKEFQGGELAKLARPGEFFDFTRYRPTVARKNGKLQVEIPNAVATYGRGRYGSNDFIFLRLPEPHHMAEAYIESIVEMLRRLGARRFGLLGSAYDMVPYTRPLMVTGAGSSEQLQSLLSSSRVISNDLEGPTTILGLVGQHMLQLQAEVFDIAVHLPGYQTPQEDFRGEKRLLEIMESMYGVAVPLEVVSKAREQEDQLRQTAEAFLLQQPQLKILLTQLEDRYDARIKSVKQVTPLSPEIENFLKDLNLRFEQEGHPPS
jgi:hypothetical protein